ncbi:hypothetical protein FF38_06686, partial [Lucilia cuprina]
MVDRSQVYPVDEKDHRAHVKPIDSLSEPDRFLNDRVMAHRHMLGNCQIDLYNNENETDAIVLTVEKVSIYWRLLLISTRESLIVVILRLHCVKVEKDGSIQRDRNNNTITANPKQNDVELNKVSNKIEDYAIASKDEQSIESVSCEFNMGVMMISLAVYQCVSTLRNLSLTREISLEVNVVDVMNPNRPMKVIILGYISRAVAP